MRTTVVALVLASLASASFRDPKVCPEVECRPFKSTSGKNYNTIEVSAPTVVGQPHACRFSSSDAGGSIIDCLFDVDGSKDSRSDADCPDITITARENCFKEDSNRRL